MNPHRFSFIQSEIKEDLSGKKVLEVGSRNIRGSIRGYLESLHPGEYTGIDIFPGEGVDLILDIHQLENHFGQNVFDLIVCSDTLEHIENQESAAYNMHSVLKIGGRLVLSVPQMETLYHGFPHDYWRITLDDLKHLYSDMKVLSGDDQQGAIVILEKQSDQFSFDTNYPLHSILRGKPILKHTFFDKKILSRYRKFSLALRKFFVRYTPSFIKLLLRKLLNMKHSP